MKTIEKKKIGSMVRRILALYIFISCSVLVVYPLMVRAPDVDIKYVLPFCLGGVIAAVISWWER